MIFFVGSGGTIVKSLPQPVYQGAANANTVYLVAPFATNGTVTVAFLLPNGIATSPAQMTQQGAVPGITDENGNEYSGWVYDLPASVTALYGVVTAQFYFYGAAGKIIASSGTSFTVGRGVPSVLPEQPTPDIYAQILSDITALQTDLNNGFYAARAIYAWNSTYNYGADEITYYPVGTYGAFVKSVNANNMGNAPYVDGVINSAYWTEVLNFNSAYAAMQNSVVVAQEAASHAESQADAAAQSAVDAAQSVGLAEFYAGDASVSASNALSSETAAGKSASAAAKSASDAQTSASLAQSYMEQAKEYAKKEYRKYDSLDDLPVPGDSAFIYIVPSSSGTGNDNYSEYIWISEDSKYEYIGNINDVDLENYAQINGTYPDMKVGNATNAQSAEKAKQDGDGNVISSTYATKAENAAKYTKPSTGIPESDLESAVQEKLDAVPAPSAANDGNLLSVQDGAYELVDPANMTVGNATNDGNGDNIADTYQKKAAGVALVLNGIEIGDQSSAAPAYIDFHTDGTSSDFNARILANTNLNELKVEVPAGGAFRVPSDQGYLPNGDVSNRAVSTQFLQPQTMFYNINGGNSVNLGYRGKSYSTTFATSQFTTTDVGNVYVVRSGNVITVGGWLKNRIFMPNGTAFTLIQGLPAAVGDSYGEATFASVSAMCRVYINSGSKNILITPSHILDATTIPSNSWFSFSITYITNE